MGHAKSKFTWRAYGWIGLTFLALFFIYPTGCTTDDLGELLASGAIGSPGGSVRADNGATLLIPEFSLNAVYRFEMIEVETKAPANHTATTLVIDLKPGDIQFNPSLPASLVLPIDRAKLPAGRLFWQIQAFRYDGTKWIATTAVLDDGNSSVTIPITQTGIYAAFIGPKPPPGEPEPEIPTEAKGEPTEGQTEGQTEGKIETTAEKMSDAAKEAVAETGAEIAKEADAGTNEPVVETNAETTPDAEPITEPAKEPVQDAGTEPTPENKEPTPENKEPTPDA